LVVLLLLLLLLLLSLMLLLLLTGLLGRESVGLPRRLRPTF